MSFQLKAQNPKGSTNHYFHHRHLLQRNHLRLHTWRITRQVSGTIEKANHNTHTALQDLENALNKISILRLSLTENFDIAKFPKIEIAFLLKALELPGHHRGKLASGQKKKGFTPKSPSPTNRDFQLGGFIFKFSFLSL
jgi:hypothetical protein